MEGDGVDMLIYDLGEDGEWGGEMPMAFMTILAQLRSRR